MHISLAGAQRVKIAIIVAKSAKGLVQKPTVVVDIPIVMRRPEDKEATS